MHAEYCTSADGDLSASKMTSEYQGGGEAVAGVTWRLRVVVVTATEREDARRVDYGKMGVVGSIDLRN